MKYLNSDVNGLFFPQDEDFVAEKDDEGSPTDDSEAEEPDASDSGGDEDAEEDEDEDEVSTCASR